MNYQIDWYEQWNTKEPLTIHLKDFVPGTKETFLMEPGPGFGDLSHPTTRLTLRMMAPHVPRKAVIDVGSGSGVLSLAAAKLGARQVYGIDIEQEAVAHATKNATLNGMQERIHFFLPSEAAFSFPKNTDLLVVMNMIYTEQEAAWASLPQLHQRPLTCITSGILKDHINIYLELCKKKGWQLIDGLEEDSWCALHFQSILNQ